MVNESAGSRVFFVSVCETEGEIGLLGLLRKTASFVVERAAVSGGPFLLFSPVCEQRLAA